MTAQPPRQRRAILSQRLVSVAILLLIVLALIMVPRLRKATGQTTTPIYKDPAAPIPNRVADLLSRMTLDEKIGQMTQADRGSLSAESDIATYYLGSILSGGGSAPTPNTPTAWADM